MLAQFGDDAGFVFGAQVRVHGADADLGGQGGGGGGVIAGEHRDLIAAAV
ncbi:Uncharacterised protein [Mycobacteroides abscessus subsp. abscessus]|nr:Uncharacterised protein [Mycobacteroides abscessus subsp. abscessus]